MNRRFPLHARERPRPRSQSSPEYRYARERADALRAASRLAAIVRREELPIEVPAALADLFPGTRQVELLLADLAVGVSPWARSPDPARRLLARLCGGIDAIPPGWRACPLSPTLVPYLVVPHLVARALGRGSMMSAPILERTALAGLIVLEADPTAPEFTVADLDVLSGVATQVSLVIERLRAAERTLERQRFENDLEIARQIQRRFLPLLPPEVNGFRVAAEYRPAYDIGGDFYDVVSSDDGSVTAVIGDVAGKGVPAALVMSRVSSDFRRLAQATSSPRALLEKLNLLLVEQSADDSFVTAACVRLDARHGRLTIANAGHVVPLVRHTTGVVAPVGQASGPPLGMLSEQSYLDQQFALLPGDILLLMTDGVAEALDHDADRMGMQTLRTLITGSPHEVGALNRRILGALEQRRPGVRADDVTLLALECPSERGRRQEVVG